MKAKCIADIDYFTQGVVYDVTHIDSDGDVWVEADDHGDAMFFFPYECELIED